MIPSFFSQTPYLSALYSKGIQRGYSPVALAGLAGNVWQESKGRSDAIGDNGHAIGGAQWNDRAPLLKAFASQHGTDWRDPNIQADYTFHELDTTERKARDALMGARTPAEAARAGLMYERPMGWNMPNFATHSTLGWGNRLNAAQQAFLSANGGMGNTSGVSPHGFASLSTVGQPPSPGISQAPQKPLESTQVAMNDQTANDAGGGRGFNFGRGLKNLGIGLLAINHPSVVSAMESGEDDKKSPKWSYRGMTSNGNGFIMQSPDGSLRIDPVPEQFRGPKETDEPSDIRSLRIMAGDPKLMEAYKAVHGGKSEAADELATPENLKIFGDMWVNGDKDAFSRLSERSRILATKTALDEIEKITGNRPTALDVDSNRGRYQQLLSSERKYGQMIEPVQAAHADLMASGKIAKEAIADLPSELTSHNLTWNKFMQMGAQELQNAGAGKLAKAREALEGVSRAYSQVLSRGSTNATVRSDEVARGLVNTAMAPDNVMGVIDFMMNSGGRVVDSIKKGHEELRQEWKQGAQQFGKGVTKREGEIIGEAYKRAGLKDDTFNKDDSPAPQSSDAPKQSSAPKGLPEGAKQAEDGNWYVQQNGKWYRVRPK